MGYIGICVFGFVFCTYHWARKKLHRDKDAISKRMKEAAGSRVNASVREEELSIPVHRRLLGPLLKGIARNISNGLPEQKELALEKKIVNAGYPGGLGPREFLVLNYFFLVIAAGSFYYCANLMASRPLQTIVLVFLGAFIGWSLPGYYLNKQVSARQEKVRRELPEVLDLLTVSVEAGLGFDGAIKKVTEKVPGVLATELQKTLAEINMGKVRREALRELADRLNVDDLSSFVGAIILADKLGISIANILRTQSAQIRQKHRQRAGERAMQAPVKMLFPIVLFIFPAIFVILLGPALIKLTEVFL